MEFYELVGGEKTFVELVRNFYQEVRQSRLLLPLYPPDDMEGAEERLRLFLIQYWGGPNTYSQKRGHPRLRMRHAQFRVGVAERDAWLDCMNKALETLLSKGTLDTNQQQTLRRYFVQAATAMVNTQLP